MASPEMQPNLQLSENKNQPNPLLQGIEMPIEHVSAENLGPLGTAEVLPTPELPGQLAAMPEHKTLPSSNESDRSSKLKKGTAVAIASLALLGGFSQVSPESAEARKSTPTAETAKAKKPAVPKLAPNMKINTAKNVLKKLGLKPAGLQPDNKGKAPKVKEGYTLVADGLSKRVVQRVKNKAGKTTTKVFYSEVRPGTKMPKGAKLYIKTKQVKINQTVNTAPDVSQTDKAPDSPVTPRETTLPPSTGEQSPELEAPTSPNPEGSGLEQTPEAEDETPVGATTPEPAPNIEPEPIESVPAPEIDLNAETEKFFKEDTVQIPFLNNCSGMLIRNEAGRILGAVSAQHCGLVGPSAVRIKGTDGNLYMVKQESLQVRRGENANEMSAVFTAGQVIVPTEGDKNHDMALIVSTDSTPEEVLSEYQKNLINNAQIAGTAKGTKVYMSGYPNAQPGNTTGVQRRETMEAEYIGPTTVYTSNNQSIDSLLVGMKPNKDGAVCSYGNSGGIGVIPQVVTEPDGTKKVEFKWLGVDAAYDDFRLPGENTVVADGYYGPNIRQERFKDIGYQEILNPDIDAICYFDYKVPGFSNRQVVKMVSSTSQVPGM